MSFPDRTTGLLLSEGRDTEIALADLRVGDAEGTNPFALDLLAQGATNRAYLRLPEKRQRKMGPWTSCSRLSLPTSFGRPCFGCEACSIRLKADTTVRNQKVRFRLIFVRLTPLADVGCRNVGDVSTPL